MMSTKHLNSLIVTPNSMTRRLSLQEFKPLILISNVTVLDSEMTPKK